MDEFSGLPLRERKRARTRSVIERSALALFVTRGFDATTVAEIAEASEIAERTFFAYFESKEDVALADIVGELDDLAALVAERRPEQPILELFRAAGTRRVELFRSHALQVRQRREVEAANPRVHARAVALREAREHSVMAPEFARELGTGPEDPRVVLITSAFTGVSSVLDRIIAEAPDDHAAHAGLQRGVDLLDAALRALRPH